MSSKAHRINQILSLASGKPYRVLRARPQLTFIRHSEELFTCATTGEQLTQHQINDKYPYQGRTCEGLPAISGFKVVQANAQGERSINSITLLEIPVDEIVIF